MPTDSVIASPRRNRVDPFGDLNAVSARGMFTGNRGCVVDDHERVVRHHGSQLWIVCLTRYRDWRWPLARPRRWTPLFFLDDAVALAAGHRPCGLCRRHDYLGYRDAVTRALGAATPLRAGELDARLRAERLARGRGLTRGQDRKLWQAALESLPDGTVIVDDEHQCCLVQGASLRPFAFSGWGAPRSRPPALAVSVLTPPTSVAALAAGYRPTLHASAVA
ncbi:MAG: hypothetical protein IT492_21275 [Gammaproteobacteria bacterium]|nr:hypothetical protein [Gammaproteobacteria bacterium]